MDSKKVFDMTTHEHLWRHMEELKVPSEYILAISGNNEMANCCVRLGDEISNF